MLRQRVAHLGLILLACIIGVGPAAQADECPERIDEAQALIREAEQALAQGRAAAERAALEEKLKGARTLVDEAQELHNADQHDASVEKAYAALAAVQEVLNTLKP